ALLPRWHADCICRPSHYQHLLSQTFQAVFMNKFLQCCTLIDLLLLSSPTRRSSDLAIPAYNDFTIRSKVTEVVNMVGVCKTSVGEYFQSNGTLPPTATEAGCSTTNSLLAQAPSVAAGVIKSTAIGSLATQLTNNSAG